MARYGFKLPDIGEGIAEAEIVTWHVKEGDLVAEDAPLVDMMTDKATVELSSPKSGRVLSIKGSPGERVRIGSEIAVLDISGQEETDEAGPHVEPDLTPAPPGVSALAAEPETPSTGSADRIGPAHEVAAPPQPGVKPLASPAVRRRARELGIDLGKVRGSGPTGRVEHADLDAFLLGKTRGPEKTGSTARGHSFSDLVEELSVIGLRRRIADQMQESKRRIPHYSYVEEVDVTSVEELRAQLNSDSSGNRPKLTLLPFVVRAVARATGRHPQINALYDDEAGVVRRNRGVHVGIATQTPQGLLVPVLRHAEARDLWEIATEIQRLASTAREGKSARSELTGSTITITSLGPLGGIAHTPVINRPEVAIVGVNRMTERPVVRQGRIEVRKMMNLSSSFDHRVVDGWDAARFIQDVKSQLEQPALLFLEAGD